MIRKLMKLKRKLLIILMIKNITTPEFNKLTAEHFAARSAQANLITKTDFDAKLSSLNRKIVSNILKNELKKLKTFDLSYFIGKSHFDQDGAQKII